MFSVLQFPAWQLLFYGCHDGKLSRRFNSRLSAVFKERDHEDS